ncbi:MAG: glycosyltransferase [Pseudobutyrivibrio ruminis]|uniref:glycosyltransferase n=1 Tax=Pseudobutyrivibrio ruminis TaxID=46206 RepID=UPI0026ED054B|nr:glycosyltransferase [Pseudobutyrivibrio ruminis]MBE5912901.1 glycosyltransferase [Pseudobutyrivibrio ruminis]
MNKLKPKVNILISTYNGAQYIIEQIESLLNQTYEYIDIFIRDDGSTDNTLEVIGPYVESGKVKLVKGTNIGFGKSFLSLLKESGDADYWAFCDQDDVWFPDKIKWAIDWFELQDNSKPLIYHSSYYLSDEVLSVTEKNKLWNYKYTFAKSLTEVIHMGFSIVINRTQRDLMLKADINNLTSHDHWAEVLAIKYGYVYEDERIASIHRRLTESQSSSSLYARFRWLRGALCNESEILPVAREYCRVFKDERDEDYNIAALFVFDKYSLKKSLKKAFYPHRWRSSISSEIIIRCLMLIGKI